MLPSRLQQDEIELKLVYRSGPRYDGWPGRLVTLTCSPEGLLNCRILHSETFVVNKFRSLTHRKWMLQRLLDIQDIYDAIDKAVRRDLEAEPALCRRRRTLRDSQTVKDHEA